MLLSRSWRLRKGTSSVYGKAPGTSEIYPGERRGTTRFHTSRAWRGQTSLLTARRRKSISASKSSWSQVRNAQRSRMITMSFMIWSRWQGQPSLCVVISYNRKEMKSAERRIIHLQMSAERVPEEIQ